MNSRYFLLAFAFFSLVLLSGIGSSVECAVSQVNGCTVSTSYTFPNTIYNGIFNGTGSLFSGAVQLTGSNLVLDGNGSIFYGNGSTTSTFIDTSGTLTNVTIRNFTLVNYYHGIQNDQGRNFTIIYNNLTNMENHIRCRACIGSNITSNIINQGRQYNTSGTGILFDVVPSGNLGLHYIGFNLINGTYKGIDLRNNHSFSIVEYNNVSYTGESSLNTAATANNNIFRYNFVNWSGWNAISFRSQNNIAIYNTFDYFNHHGVDIQGCTDPSVEQPYNNTIEYNLMTNGLVSNGIYLCAASNNTIQHNIIYNISSIIDGHGIMILGESSISSNNLFNNNSINKTIGTSVFLRNGTNNNFYNMFFSDHIDPEGIRVTKSINTSFQNITWYDNPSIYLDNATNFDYNNFYPFSLNVTNINKTFNQQVIFKSLTNSLIYFSNNSVACSDISTCNGNINITLTPNNFSYVLDNFNLTEGVTRQFNPLSISGTSTSKTITSTLSQSINAKVVVNGEYDFGTYNGDTVYSISSSGGQSQFLLEIPSGSSLLTFGELQSTGVCSTLLNLHTLTAGKMALLFLVFIFGIILATVFGIITLTGGESTTEKGNPYMVIFVFIAMLVGAILVGISALITTSLCAL